MIAPKILLVSQGILPFNGGSSFIVEKLSQNFSHNEMVVIGEKNGKPFVREPNLPKFYYCPTSISLKGRAKRLFTYIRWLFFPLLLYRLNKIVEKEACKVVLAVFPEEFYLLAAYLIAKYKQLDFYSYFHNTYIENSRTGIWKLLAKWLQPRVFSLSKTVFVMSEGMCNYYNKQKTNQGIIFEPLIHTFNEYLPIYKAPGIDINNSPLKLVLVGTFNLGNIDATIRFLNAIEGNDFYQISIYTATPKWIMHMKGIKSNGWVYKGFIEDEKLLTRLQNYDIMVLTHGLKGSHNPVEYQTIFPTRTIPFLISGKPIFAHSPKGSFLNRFLIKYDCAEIVDQPDEEVIVETLDRLVDSPQRCRQLVKNAFKAADQFYGPNVAKKLKSIIWS